MNLQQALNNATQQLVKHHPEAGQPSAEKEPRLDAEVLLAFVLDKDKAFLYAHPELKLSSIQHIRFNRLVKKRQLHAPVAYLTRRKTFYGRVFKVTPATLIPRPETETLVEYIVNEYKDQKHLNVIDIGTGSGVIGITLSLEIPTAHVYASDLSHRALQVARTNNKRLESSVVFTKSNLLTSISGEFDIIIANLPYLAPSDVKHSPTREDLLYEPQMALIAADDGLELIKKLIKQSEPLLTDKGCLYLELLPRQMNTLKSFVSDHTSFSFQTIKDLSGKERFVRLQKNKLVTNEQETI